MTTVNTRELTGPALDWAVAKALGSKHITGTDRITWPLDHSQTVSAVCWFPSKNWEQGGPIIEREQISTCWEGTTWVATLFNKNCEETWYGHQYGPTPLIAAMRCFVASRLGESVDIPEELL